jgi:hypothetical protein
MDKDLFVPETSEKRSARIYTNGDLRKLRPPSN